MVCYQDNKLLHCCNLSFIALQIKYVINYVNDEEVVRKMSKKRDHDAEQIKSKVIAFMEDFFAQFGANPVLGRLEQLARFQQLTMEAARHTLEHMRQELHSAENCRDKTER